MVLKEKVAGWGETTVVEESSFKSAHRTEKPAELR